MKAYRATVELDLEEEDELLAASRAWDIVHEIINAGKATDGAVRHVEDLEL